MSDCGPTRTTTPVALTSGFGAKAGLLGAMSCGCCPGTTPTDRSNAHWLKSPANTADFFDTETADRLIGRLVPLPPSGTSNQSLGARSLKREFSKFGPEKSGPARGGSGEFGKVRDVVVSRNAAVRGLFRLRRSGTVRDANSWLPFLDTYRTMCRAPEPDFRQILEDIRELRFAA
jgi:hypothetical protein